MNRNCLVLICKLPAEGTSKTRLIPAIGLIKAKALAVSMLQDVLVEFGAPYDCKERDSSRLDCYWFFSPSDAIAEAASLLHNINCADRWLLEPNRSKKGAQLGLGDALSSLYRKFIDLGYCTVSFIGGDTPFLRRNELYDSIEEAMNGNAYICPATDGGYVLLSVPSVHSDSVQANTNNNQSAHSSNIIKTASSDIDCLHGMFDNIRWSTEYTCIDQIMQLRKFFNSSAKDDSFVVIVGNTYSDIDDSQDLEYLQCIHAAAKKPASTCDIDFDRCCGSNDWRHINGQELLARLKPEHNNSSSNMSCSVNNCGTDFANTVRSYNKQCYFTQAVLDSLAPILKQQN